MKQQTKLFTQSFHHLLTFSMIKTAVKNKNTKFQKHRKKVDNKTKLKQTLLY